MMSDSGQLLGAAIGLPLILLLACTSSRLHRWLPQCLRQCLIYAPLPALAAALFAAPGSSLALGNTGLLLALDTAGSLLLGAAALLWILAGGYAAHTLRAKPGTNGFVVCWLMSLSGNIGVFLAADLISFYAMLAVLSIGASGLVLQGTMPQAGRAGALYLGLALLAEAFLLAALVLLAQAMPAGSLLIRDAAAALNTSPWRDATLVLLLIGLSMKAGLLPLHFWMPPAYQAAPIPAAAVLSGAVVKASVIAFLRFLPWGTVMPTFGTVLTVLGLLGALYGVRIGLTQQQPKRVLAYSSVSQMGFIVALLGMGLRTGDHGTAWIVAFYAVHHLLVKGALFLAIGVVMRTGRRHLWPMLLPAALIALGLGGLPLTGGALSKYAAKSILGTGLVSMAALVSSVATTLLMMHFLRCLRDNTATDPAARPPLMLAGCWLFMAGAALAVPWTIYLAVPLNTLTQVLAPAALWSTLWPTLLGLILACSWQRGNHGLPTMPTDNLSKAMLIPMLSATATWLEQVDTETRRWSVACVSLLLLASLFGWALIFG